ncbi:metallophosphoesterase [Salicibibacter cibarius]|uniref:Phosphoesterase n=1 Tax=Salicibibacter cibarius TaxID=2743000 RepID=A0A7T6Z7M7_9BACI|nr:metallophosphoesterase [Salicibibacter cibarius]QQK78370.1 metallophosphoesterase [Salicibibacter cibarius]
MKVIVVSDTHMKGKVPKLPFRLRQELEDVDFIIHAGDWSTLGVYDALAAYAPVEGVHGNIDDDGVRVRFPAKQVLELNGYSIGIVHGHGHGNSTERRAVEAFSEQDVNIIIFGHSHIPSLRYFKKQLLINPGSPTDKRANPFYSYASLELGAESRVAHVFYSTAD